ncbi:MAG TPA: hypothetical protein VGO45_14525 [Bacteroidia bacterium]|nr:hypothetical protein [Bacteroidia bacterium]
MIAEDLVKDAPLFTQIAPTFIAEVMDTALGDAIITLSPAPGVQPQSQVAGVVKLPVPTLVIVMAFALNDKTTNAINDKAV